MWTSFRKTSQADKKQENSRTKKDVGKKKILLNFGVI
jgi:hypothetical protein